jgi:signal transduction histidine kinase
VVRVLRFWHRLALLVLLGAAALMTVTATALLLGRQSRRELRAIETRYVPLIELDRDLRAALARITRALEDAAGAAEEGPLADADHLDREFLARLASGRDVVRGNGGDLVALESDYRRYFASAREVSAALIQGTPATQLGTEVETMLRARQVLAAHLEAATTPDRRRLAAAFETARKSQEDALAIEIAVALAAVVAMVLLSWRITLRTVRSLQAVSVGVERLARGNFGEEIVVADGDEIGDLAREANRTAARLREYRERAETLLAETQRQAQELVHARRAQEERAEAAENAARELDAFSYSVAHDLRAPLRSIDGFSQALLEDYFDGFDEAGRRYLRFVREAAQQMAQLIDDLLTLSRVTRSELQCEPLDLAGIARAAIEKLRQAQPNRQVEIVIRDEHCDENGDPHLLSVVLNNLLGNAWKFTGKSEQGRIEVGTTLKNGQRTHFVQDNGAGFDMAYANKLFGVFQRLHAANEFEGTGVGLAIVQRIIRRHGGHVWAEGKVGQGATFYFTLHDEERVA